MANPKRIPKPTILGITIQRVLDDSADTSWLGEYSRRPDSDYSIDRRHSEDCSAVSIEAKNARENLERVLSHIESDLTYCEEHTHTAADSCGPCVEEMAGQEAVSLLSKLVEEATECDCNICLSSREYEYFNPNWRNYKGEPEEDIRKYCRQDYERMEALNRGDFCFIGVRAEAKIGIPQGLPQPKTGQAYLLQNLTSGGLYGIESDSDGQYIATEEKNQLDELRDVLTSFGFSRRSITARIP
jgi:hypothetical protein